MKMRWPGTITTLLLLFVTRAIFAGAPPDLEEPNWPQWRGPNANGSVSQGTPPVEWGEEHNLAWKVDLPGKGSSSPIVWGDRIYLTTAVPTGKTVAQPEAEQAEAPPGRRGPRRSAPREYLRFAVLAIDRDSGRTVWEKTVLEELPHEGTHQTATFASNSAVTDGEHVYAFFGSRGLYCLDRSGEIVWSKDLGEMTVKMSFGEGASPALHGDLLVVPWDHEGQSFVVALNKHDGSEVWRKDRDETTAWATPLIVDHEAGAQVITNATNKVRSYSLRSGDLVWEATGMTANTIPSPVEYDGLVFLTSGFRGNALLAVRLSAAKGDITGTDAVVWTLDRDTPYVPSPLLYKGILYLLKGNSGILSAFDARTGERHYARRLEGLGNIYASPVAANDHLYVTDRDGKTVVVATGPEFEMVATNSLDDVFDASMAVVGDAIYLRGAHLYKISATTATDHAH